MADEPKKEESKKEETVSWRDAAKKEGYAFLPATEFEEMKKGIGTLKSIRSKIPDDYRDKEDDYLTEASVAIETVKKGVPPDVEAIKNDLTSTKSKLTKAEKATQAVLDEIATLRKTNKTLTMWGHIEGIAKSRNIYVSDRLIKDVDIDGFPIEEYDTSKEGGTKALSQAIWEKIVEPAYNEQIKIARAGGGGSRSADSAKRGDTIDTDKERKIPSIGSLA